MTEIVRPASAEDRVLRAQLDLLVGHLRGIITGTFLTGTVLALAVSNWLNSTWPWVWLATLGLLTVLRYAHYRACRTAPAPGRARRRYAALTALSCVNASLWGLFGWWSLTPEAPTGSLAVVMVLVGLVASATGFISHLRLMYLLYVVPMLLPAAIRFGGFEQDEYRLIGALIAFYGLVVFVTSRATRDAVLEAIRLQFLNLDLVADLQAESGRSDAARQSAEQANRAKSLFLAAASHDLRQPLHSLRLFTATLAHQLAAPDDRRADARRLVGRMDASVNALDGLFESILELSKLDAGTLVPDRRHIDLDDLLQQAIDDIASATAEKGLVLRRPAMPDGARVVESDPMLLRRLLGNLLSNAVRYTSAGEVAVRVRDVPSTASDAAPDGWWIDVVDTGIGIDDADRDRVFEAFVQLGNPERDRSRGIGLGLSIVARVARLLELPLELTSRPGNGSTFSVRVPAGRIELLETEPAVPPDRATDLLDGRLVLIIDDEADVRDALEGLVATWGADGVAVASASEAVATLEEIGRPPSVIVSDWRLRGSETGDEAVAAVRRHVGHDVPAVVITGDVAPARLSALADSGFPVLHKPCDPIVLRRTLERALRSSDMSAVQ